MPSGEVVKAAEKIVHAMGACLSRSSFNEGEQLAIIDTVLGSIKAMSESLHAIHGPTDDELLAEPDEREDDDEEEEEEDGEDEGDLDDENDDA